MPNLFPRRNRDLFDHMRDVFDRGLRQSFADDFFAPMSDFFSNQSFKMDVKDDGNAYLVEAELPGIEKDDISVEYKGDYVTIRAKREDHKETKDEKNNYVRRERSYGSFERSFYVGDIDEKQIKGKFKNGVLQLSVPKGDTGEKTYRIELD